MDDLGEGVKKIVKVYHNYLKCEQNFDFERVETVMKALNWKWGLRNGSKIPSIKEMKKLCGELYSSTLENFDGERDTRISSGGFQIEVSKHGHVELSFVVESYDTAILADIEDEESNE